MPGSPVGGSYQFLDETAEPGAPNYYWLEDVDLYGQTTLHGPVAAKQLFRMPVLEPLDFGPVGHDVGR
jgi:hypothetical protein